MKLVRSSLVFSFPLPLRRLLFIKDATKNKRYPVLERCSLNNQKSIKCINLTVLLGFPGCWGVKNALANERDARDLGPIPGSERSPRVGNGNLLQYSCLGYSAQKNLVVYSPWSHKESKLTDRTHTQLCFHS